MNVWISRALSWRHTIPVLLLLVLALSNVLMKEAFFDSGFSNDAQEYTQTSAWFLGQSDHPNASRLLKPLAPIAIAGFSVFTEGDLRQAMLLHAYFMYLLMALAAYALVYAFSESRFWGLAGGALIFAGYPVLNYGLDNYTETGAWALYLAGLAGVWGYLRSPRIGLLIWTVVVISLDVLWKEYGIVAGVVLAIAIASHPRMTPSEKGRHFAIAAGTGAVILLPWLYYVYAEFHYSYLDWYGLGTKLVGTPTDERNFKNISKSLVALMLLGWSIVPLGLMKWRDLTPEQRRFLLVLLAPSFMFLFWGFVSSRLFYVAAPLMTLTGISGLRSVLGERRKLAVLIVTIILLGNYIWLFINPLFRQALL